MFRNWLIAFLVVLMPLAVWSMPLGSWQLNESAGTSASDSSDFHNDAVLVGTANWSTDCFLFGGSNYFRIQKGAQGLPFDFSKSFRLSMQMKTNLASSTACLFTKQDNSWVYGCKSLYLVNGVLNFNCSNVGGASGKTCISDNTWHEVGVFFEAGSGTILLLVDGKIDGAASLPGLRWAPDDFDAYIGTQAGINNFIGAMKSVLIESDIRVGTKPKHADFNGDGYVDSGDLIVFAANWLASSCSGDSWCQNTSLDMDDTVGLADFSLFASEWLRSPGLTAHLPFDAGTLADVVGDHNGIVTAGSPVYSTSVPAPVGSGKSLYFDGNDRVDLSDTNDFVFSNYPFTLSVWIKTGSASGTIFNRGPANGSHVPGDKWLGISGGKVALDAGWTGTVFGTSLVNDNQWHHVAMTIEFETAGNKDTVCLYVDGELQGTSSSYNLNTYPETNFATMIGGGQTFYYGYIDDVKVLRRVLSRDEIRSLFNTSAASSPVPANASSDCSVTPVLAWRAGRAAVSHNVYLGTSYAAVSVASTVSAEYKGNFSTTAYTCPVLNLNTTYYWRVDEVMNGGYLKKGYVWSFTPTYDVRIPCADNYYVALTGSDNNPGTQAQPFATIARARDQIKADLRRGDVNSKNVFVRGGKYYLSSGLVFGENDCGRRDQIITYQAYPGEQVTIVGGMPVSGWQLDSGNIYKAYVGTRKFYCLFENGTRCTMARTPNNGYLAVAQAVSATQFGYNAGELPASFNYGNAQVFAWPGNGNWNWWSITQPITNIDFAGRRITITNPTGWALPAGNRYFVQGVKELLDSPGEFYLDASGGYLYYWPRSLPISEQEIIAPNGQKVLEIHGSTPEKPVKDLVFQNLTLTISDFDKSYAFGYPTQASPEENPQGLVYLENAQGVKIRNCRITNAGFSGIMLNRHAQNNTISGNVISNIGYHGVYFHGWACGLGPFANAAESFTNKNNIVSSNCILDCGLLCGHGSGIFILQSGNNEISNNFIRVTSSRGICIQGEAMPYMPAKYYDTAVTWDNHWDFVHSRNNVIKFNDAAGCFQDTQDAGVFYCQSMGKYNQLYNNALHDSISNVAEAYVYGIYVDDAASYLKIQNNLVYGINSATNHSAPMFMKGVYNTAVNNIFVDCSYLWDSGFWAMGDSPNHHITFLRNIAYRANGKYVYSFFDWQDDSNRMLESDYNIFYHPGGTYEVYGIPGSDTWVNWKLLFNRKYDQHSLTSDPLFKNRLANDYTLQNSSPALGLGFQNVSTDNIGPKSDFPYIVTLPAAGRFKLNQTSGLTAIDSSGYANNGAVTGSAAWQENAFYFNGSNYITISDSPKYRCNGPFTWTAWIKTTSANGTIIARDELAAWTPGAKELYVDATGKIAFGTGWAGIVTGSTTVTDGQWHLVAVTYQAGVVKIYVDGKFDGYGLIELEGVADSGFGMRIGVQNVVDGSSYAGFQGLLKNVSIFRYALTNMEMQKYPKFDL